MKTNDAINLAGNARALAGLLQITRSAVSQWGDDVPALRAFQLREKCPTWFSGARTDDTLALTVKRERRLDGAADMNEGGA